MTRSSLQSRVEVPTEVVFRQVDDEAVLLDLESGEYYGLNPVGCRIWNAVTSLGRIELAVLELLAEFEVSEGRLERDVLALVDELLDRGLLRVSDA